MRIQWHGVQRRLGAPFCCSLHPPSQPFGRSLKVSHHPSLVPPLRSWLDCSLSGNLPLDLTAMGDPTRSIAPDGIALGIAGPRKPLHHDNVAIPGEGWASIPPQQCHKLITSMPRRIETVIKAKGAPTKY